MVTVEKLLIRTGVFSIREEEVRLYRIMDLTLKRSFGRGILEWEQFIAGSAG